MLSLTQGRPTAIHESSFDVEECPAVLHRDTLTYTAASPSDVINWQSQLGLLQHRFSNITNQASSSKSVLHELETIDFALQAWCNEIPQVCRPGEEILVPDEMKHVVVSLHMEYFNLIRAVHWASLTYAHNQKHLVNASSNPRMKGSEAICVAASRSLIKAMNRYD